VSGPHESGGFPTEFRSPAFREFQPEMSCALKTVYSTFPSLWVALSHFHWRRRQDRVIILYQLFVGDQPIIQREMEGSEEVSMKELKETVMFLVKQSVELKGAFSKTASVSGYEAQRGSSSGLEARLEPKEPRTPVQPSRSRVGKVESKWSAKTQCCTMNQLMSAPEVSYSDTEIDSSPSPGQQTQVVLPIREFPLFEGKKGDVVTFIWQVDEIATLARWSDREWVFNMADLVG